MVGGVNINVRFMDTSIVMNLLEVPHMCADAESVKSEFAKAVAEKETLILPMSTIIESGNHIAHITNGTIRRDYTGNRTNYDMEYRRPFSRIQRNDDYEKAKK